MNVEIINKNLTLSLRGIDDSLIEDLYYFLFSKKFNMECFAHRMAVEKVSGECLNFLLNNKNYKLLTSSEYFKIKNNNEKEDFNWNQNLGEDFHLSDQNGFIFTYIDKKNKYPILIKLLSRGDGYLFSAASYCLEELRKLIIPLKDKFIFKQDNENKIYFGILFQEGSDLLIKKIPFNAGFVKNINLEDNYGSEFIQHNDKIIANLNNHKNGILIFNGTRGCGKSTYIKHLAKIFGEKRMFIFIPTHYLNELVSPSLIPILLENKDSVLVLEDAEKAVVSRERGEGNESSVSTLLNIGDGILGSMLNLTVILTFNTDLENIDSSISRKGRLLYQHTFDKLNTKDSQSLIDKLGKKYKATESMSLADIYGIEESNNFKEKDEKKIGFY